LVLGRTRHVVDLQPYAEGDGVFLSREHAAIELKVDGSAFVEDLGSANGTWLRDVELKPYVRCEVGDCDEVTLAGDVLTVVYWAPRARPE
jgi:pSer/pThr/pTyr-binding forkhead associated (FHA) protein